MQFYLVARGAPPMPLTPTWGCPGKRFFVKKRVGAHVCVMAAHSGVRSHQKSPLRRPRSPKWSPKAHFEEARVTLFRKMIVAPLREPQYLLYFNHIGDTTNG